jgi:pimeloyl-ACP methyl ester carboxylesterase
MQVIADNLLTHYELTGKGKTVLLLHGWGDSLATYASLQTTLAKKYQVLAIDLPGFGSSQAPPKAWNLDNYSQFLASCLTKLDIKNVYAIIGHSNGAALAIRAINLGQVTPSKLVLLAAAGIRAKGSPRRVAIKIVAKVGNVLTMWLPERYRRRLRKSIYGVAGSDMLAVPELQETFKLTVRQDVQADAANLSVATLLIFAANDRAVPVSDGQLYHSLIKSSQLEVIPASEHFVHHDQAHKVETLIEDFLHA